MRLWTKVGFFLAGVGLVVSGVGRLNLETDILATLPADLPEAEGLKLLRDGFSGGDELLLGMELEDGAAGGDLSGSLAKHLEGQPALVARVQWAGALENPDTASGLLSWVLLNAPPGNIAALRERLQPDRLGAHLEGVMERLAGSPDPAEVQRWSYDPLGLLEAVDAGTLRAMEDSGFSMASADGTLRLLLVSPQDPPTGYKEAAAWLKEMKAQVKAWRSQQAGGGEGIKFHWTGEPVFMAETGSGIERDLSGTISLATLLIAALFWFMFRRWRILVWIQVLLAVVVVLTLALGGWILGELSIMSLGFASILLGIAVDYAVFILQKGMDHPELSVSGLRRRALPPILGGACTTATVFLALLFSGLPGLADMGLMVALGVAAGLVVMVIVMPWVVVRSGARIRHVPAAGHGRVSSGGALCGTLLVIGLMAGIFFWKGFPAFQPSSTVLRPAASEAMTAWETLQRRLGRMDEAAVVLLGTAPDWHTLKGTLAPVTETLERARRQGLVRRYSLPSPLMPDAAAQRRNLPVLAALAAEEARLQAAVLDAGFTEDATLLSKGVWHHFAGREGDAVLSRPDAPAAAAAVDRVLALSPVDGRASWLGSVSFAGEPGSPDLEKMAALETLLRGGEAHLAGWETLGPALSARIKHDLARLMVPLVLVLALMLGLTFRNAVDFSLAVLMLVLGLAALAATMAVLGQTWNLANVAALPLLLGLGIDYGIHMLLALKEEGGDIRKVRATTGRAVFFCGVTTVIGFSSLVFASNRGVASLGLACSVGTLWTLLFALWLLPHWRAWFGSGRAS